MIYRVYPGFCCIPPPMRSLPVSGYWEMCQGAGDLAGVPGVPAMPVRRGFGKLRCPVPHGGSEAKNQLPTGENPADMFPVRYAVTGGDFLWRLQKQRPG